MSLLTTIDNCVALAVTLFVNCVGFMSLLNTRDHSVTLSAYSYVTLINMLPHWNAADAGHDTPSLLSIQEATVIHCNALSLT